MQSEGIAQENSVLTEAAIGYASKGWKVFPLAPIGEGAGREDGKTPYPGSHGFKDATDDLDFVASFWEETPDANIGLWCEGSGLVVLDVDLDLEKEEDAKRWAAFLENHPLPSTFTQKTAGGGLHLVFRDPGNVRFSGSVNDDQGKIADIKHKGYILLAPSVAQSGRRDAPGAYGVLDECVPAPAPDWLFARRDARTSGSSNEKGDHLRDRVRDTVRKESNRQLLDLLQSKRNTLDKRDDWLRLGLAMHAAYVGTHWERETYTAWVAFSERWEAPRGKKPGDYAGNAETVWSNAQENRENRVGAGTAVKLLTGLPTLPPADVEVDISPELDKQREDRAVKLSGLAGAIAKVVWQANDRDLKVFPAAAALMAMSALASPNFVIAGPQGQTALNLYGLLLGSTGSGKEASRNACNMVLGVNGRSDELLASVASDKALHRALADGGGAASNASRGALTLAMDEGGLHLEAIRSGNNGHQKLLLSLLMQIWGVGLGRLPPHRYADNRNTIPGVERPRITLLLTSTLEAMLKASSAEDSESGQLNRFLTFVEDGLPPLRDGEVNRDALRNPPDEIVHAASKFRGRGLRHSVHAGLQGDETDQVIPMSSSAQLLWKEFRAGEVERHMQMGGSERESWARASEYALRVAGLLALSDAAWEEDDDSLKDAKCDKAHVELAIEIVSAAASRTAYFARNAGMSEIETLKEKVKEAITELAGEDGYAPANKVNKKVFRGQSGSRRDDILGTLIDDGEIIVEQRDTSGRPAKFYAIARPATARGRKAQ